MKVSSIEVQAEGQDDPLTVTQCEWDEGLFAVKDNSDGDVVHLTLEAAKEIVKAIELLKAGFPV